MKTKLLKKWRKLYRSTLAYQIQVDALKNEPKWYATKSLGDKFFARWIKYSRYWAQVEMQYDLQCDVEKSTIHEQILNKLRPSVRYSRWRPTSYRFILLNAVVEYS